MKDTHLQFTQDSLRKFVGIPYEKTDCYELVQSFYKEFFNINLTTLYGKIRPTKEETQKLVDQEKHSNFIEVTKPQFGDIILISIRGLTCHIGLYIDETHFLHSRSGVGSSLDRVSTWEKRFKGYYRCPKL